MWLESEPGRGSTFHFTCRFGVPSAAVQRRVRSCLPRLLGLPVLIVDDNRTNLRILKETLALWGLQPTTVESGPDALIALTEAQPRATPTRCSSSTVRCRTWTATKSPQRRAGDAAARGDADPDAHLQLRGSRMSARCRMLGVCRGPDEAG